MSVNKALQVAPLSQRLAAQLKIQSWQVEAVMTLLDEGATVPFIARYRKERTGALDDAQLRDLNDQLSYGRELDKRRESIFASLQEQGVLNDQLLRALTQADSKQALEDLYLPFKPRRQTKGQKAIEAGLQPLAEALLQPQARPLQLAAGYISSDKGIENAEQALEGAEAILQERFTEQPQVLGTLRPWLARSAWLAVRAKRGQAKDDSKYRDYFAHQESLSRAPSHRMLAILRGEREGVLHIDLQDGQESNGRAEASALLLRSLQQAGQIGSQLNSWLQEVLQRTWSDRLLPSLGKDVLQEVRERAEQDAVAVFALNLRDLLMAAPAGGRATLGLDPGLRTGVKVALISATGQVAATTTIYPHVPQQRWQESLTTLASLCQQGKVELIAVGNGTASRETEQLARELAALLPSKPQVVMVSEAGASVYSASALASQELPELDVSLRGAVSIARRLQDPLAELVKIEPKAIGVGQYQHDVNQTRMAVSLDAVVEDCVNAVGVDLNTASPALLARVAGLNSGLAEAIVGYRNQHGPFQQRQELLKVPRLGPKTFQQAAGFLRIRNGKQPLDASAVHPESYAVVEQMARSLGCKVEQLLGQSDKVQQLDLRQFVSADVGDFTLRDIQQELLKPGRDPRPTFATARFDERVQQISDLQPDMQLEGVVTNVTDFGAFVDIGVHQDGLVHISQLCDRFIKHPREVVQSGQIVQVRVLEVDAPRKRISLSMKSPEGQHAGGARGRQDKAPQTEVRPARSSKPASTEPAPQGALAAALLQAKSKR
ncbi:Tex family protein [Pokkaliibacter sp. MBI-7]|uniref:Tex family protein n=1 Tax=Pokkaliibacter sp. MBI-7 TaxID=3040600 RepID=UPI002449FD0E|nr:Tex family protein [Pokkaliibacter sp. MBI-7]MDH2432275.1 Tex family protein [Pokkaliibacter sp. MBI-7]